MVMSSVDEPDSIVKGRHTGGGVQAGSHGWMPVSNTLRFNVFLLPCRQEATAVSYRVSNKDAVWLLHVFLLDGAVPSLLLHQSLRVASEPNMLHSRAFA